MSKLWVIPASDHSLCAAPNPRLINRRNPCPSLTCPNTGSTSTPRFLYRARPRFVSSLRSILSLGLSPFGIRPRGHPFSRSIFRCFQSLVVAIRSSGISGQEQALMLASLQYPASARPAFGRPPSGTAPAARRSPAERRTRRESMYSALPSHGHGPPCRSWTVRTRRPAAEGLQVHAFGQVPVGAHQNPVPQTHALGDGQQEEEVCGAFIANRQNRLRIVAGKFVSLCWTVGRTTEPALDGRPLSSLMMADSGRWSAPSQDHPCGRRGPRAE